MAEYDWGSRLAERDTRSFATLQASGGLQAARGTIWSEALHKRGRGGKFVSKAEQTSTKLIRDSQEPGGGFTKSVQRGKADPRTGYVVARRGTSGYVHRSEAFDASGNVTPQAIKAHITWMRENRRAIKQAGHVGGWHDPETGDLTFDIVDIKHARDKAISLGKERNQKAIFHLDTFTEIPTGGTGDALRPDSRMTAKRPKRTRRRG